MNIGFLSQALPVIPSKDGFRTYGGNLIRCMAGRHQVDLISLTTEEDERHLDWPNEYCRSIRTIPVRTAAFPVRCASLISSHLLGRPLHLRHRVGGMVNMALREGRWDVLHVEGPYVGGLLPTGLAVPKILSVHDSRTLRCEEMLKCTQVYGQRVYYGLLRYHERRYERLVYPRFDRCVLVSDKDRDEVANVVPQAKVATVPYGTDTAYFRPVRVEKQPLVMVFHGNLAYPPNIEAALILADEILPRVRSEEPKAVFRLVAADPVATIRALAQRPGIELIESPPDIRPHVCSSAVYVCPIRHGTGMKTKMLEAMAMQMPIVCYSASIAGIDCVPEQHVWVAADHVGFAGLVVRSFRNPLQAEAMALSARLLAEATFSWQSRLEMFECLYAQVIEESRRRHPFGISLRPGG